jgi:outer membrane protein OmpA-like peptidoglycan-associated protein
VIPQTILKKTKTVSAILALAVALLAVVPLSGCGGEAGAEEKGESRRTANVKPAELPPLAVKQLPSGDEVISLPSDLYFAFDSADLNRAGRSQLRHEVLPRVRVFLAGAGSRVLLRGFTDGSGTDAYNARLSERRAGAVRGLLVAGGVAAARLTARGFGERLATSSKPDRSLRRVDVVFQKGGP